MRTLVLGAGKHQRIEGAIHHDQFKFDGIDLSFDLNNPNWSGFECIDTLIVNKIIISHVVEHLQSLIQFMDNAWVVLQPNGVLEIETPNAGVNPDLEFCDPTHVRCFRPYTFHNYFTPYGIEKFGYTNKAWEIIEIKTIQLEVPDDVICVKLTPIK